MSSVTTTDDDHDSFFETSAPAAPTPAFPRLIPRAPKLASHPRIYGALRWAYQPLKVIRRQCGEQIARARSRKRIEQYVARDGFKGLHAGCGPFRLADWLNTEYYGCHEYADLPLDLTRRFPLPDERFDAVYSSEVVEHLERGGVLNFFRESYRVLKPGGVIRLTTPDLAECCKLFLGLNHDVKIEQFSQTWLNGEFSPENWINSQFLYYGHKHLYSLEGLGARLEHAGFRNIVRCPPQESTLPPLRGLEQRYGKNAPPWLWCRTLIVEATK